MVLKKLFLSPSRVPVLLIDSQNQAIIEKLLLKHGWSYDEIPRASHSISELRRGYSILFRGRKAKDTMNEFAHNYKQILKELPIGLFWSPKDRTQAMMLSTIYDIIIHVTAKAIKVEYDRLTNTKNKTLVNYDKLATYIKESIEGFEYNF
jgi:hypothetical protein